jgi:protein O-GlcNAc transferase
LLMLRLSPINIYWIGHGGNLGLDFIDYIINDSFTADQAVTDIELEKEIRLPSAFATSGVFEFDNTLSKTDFGFAEDAIVINAFNNHMKINNAYLDALVCVLVAAPKAVIWFNEANKRDTVWKISNYLKTKGIDDSRYVFASRVEPKSKHYARLHVSDFAMDTFTVCMASGTLDNMWAELPVISMPGDRYTNRTAGSFNHVMGLDCLNASSIEEYVKLAIELATSPDKLARLKHHLKTYKRQTSMFDGAKFAKEVAAGLHAAVARSRQDFKPADIDVPLIFEPIPKFC